MKANASKHKAMSYGRMKEKQQQLKDEVKQLLEQAEAADDAEDVQYGDKRGDELPEELRRRETRLKKIKGQRSRRATSAGKAGEGRKTRRSAKEARGQGSIQLHRSGVAHHERRDGFVQGYNAQAAVEPSMLLIVGQA